MNKPVTNKNGSLLERAAEVYDFSAHFRTPAIPESDLPPVAAPRPVAAEPPRPAVAPMFAPAPTVRAAPPIPDREVAIDRALLAGNGLLVPGAAVGVLAEEFRLAKRQLLLTARRLTADPAKARTMLVCSPKPGDGKTYCAVNLAISLAAERDLRVLLVDADFAKPDVMNRLGVADGPGLLDALSDPSIDIERCVVGTDVPNLSLLPAGAGSTADTELIASDRTRALIEHLLAADPDRVVIFDSPPALAASPASVLALHVGQVMLVVRADRTSEGEIRDTVQRLEGCEHIQLLLNKVAFAPGGDRFGSYYGQEDEGQ
ncbi:AAA family ATPase [Sphingomonas sp.]|jgi:exopolysaccharide/PEP-CTERM locus tyrosine autokinase|uniref:AAA family ATPase n=1 Tax=Sphingomonas sp. TaxID=28214 RepID=UPI002E336B7D|nr:AAA family ATPase [Sphingomonas sp.]HEX4693939.1 AAA family ATPase [Sphingomonas sp.]